MTDADVPLTFTAPAYILFDHDMNAALTTEWGNLAIFTVKAVADGWAARSNRNIVVRAVRITPVDQH